ncbi:MAG: 16S rRNA processing protein RimM [Desulfobacteraceae bacterium]|nr:16S rRNA processing protein RimM [Desulfobacteraceae bacterium]
MPELIQIGKVIGAHGIRGAVKVYNYAESLECFAPGPEIMFIDNDGNTLYFSIIKAQPYKNVIRLTLKGISTRNQAEELIGYGLFISKSDLPELEEDTHYWADLIGMTIFDTNGADLGKVSNIIPTGANDVLVVKTPEHCPEQEILVPFIASVVLKIDYQKSCIRVQLPEGLVDL